MEQVELRAEIRGEIGKQAARRLRGLGLIPAIVYGGGQKTVNIKVDAKGFEKALHTSAGENVLINLKISGAERRERKETVIIKEIQYDPVRGDIYHVDFNHISLKEVVKVKVPVTTMGESPGVKEGGSMEQILWEVEVECLPTKIPEKLEIDISSLVIGDTIHVKDLVIPEGVEVLNPQEDVVLSIVPPMVEVEEVVPAAEEVAEPEVIGKKEKEEVPEEAPEEAKPKKEEKPKSKKEAKEE